MMITATRFHDFSAGHRVFGHESCCAHLHGHNYRIHFTLTSERLDPQGRVLDFGSIKDRLCDWLEAHWDHRFLIFALDPWAEPLKALDPEGMVVVPFNPTAENMAEYLLREIGPRQLADTHCFLIRVVVEETRKCLARADV